MPAKEPAAYMRDYRARHRQPIEPRPCQHCENPFTPQRSDARFCCDACRSAARQLRVDVTWVRMMSGGKDVPKCAEPGCDAEYAKSDVGWTTRWVERRYHVGTGQTEELSWCDEHADRPPVRKATVRRTGVRSTPSTDAADVARMLAARRGYGPSKT